MGEIRCPLDLLLTGFALCAQLAGQISYLFLKLVNLILKLLLRRILIEQKPHHVN